MALPEVGVRISTQLNRSALRNLTRYENALRSANRAMQDFARQSGTVGRALQAQARQINTATNGITQAQRRRSQAQATALTQEQRAARESNRLAQQRQQTIAQLNERQRRQDARQALLDERQRQRANQAQIRQQQVLGRQVQREQAQVAAAEQRERNRRATQVERDRQRANAATLQQRRLETRQERQAQAVQARQFEQQRRVRQRQIEAAALDDQRFARQRTQVQRGVQGRVAGAAFGAAGATARGLGAAGAAVGGAGLRGTATVARATARGLGQIGVSGIEAARGLAQTQLEARQLRRTLDRNVGPSIRRTEGGLRNLGLTSRVTGRTLRNSIAGGLTGAVAQFGGINAALGTTALAFGNVGFAAAAGLGAGLAAVVREGASYEQALTNAASVSANLGDAVNENGVIIDRQAAGLDELAEAQNRFGEVSRRLGRETTFTAGEAAEGLVFLSRAGLSTDAAVGTLEQTIRFAEASLGEIGLADAANLATNAMTAFGLRGDFASEAALNVTRTTDAMTSAANNSNTSIGQLAQALSFAGTLANDLGISVEETSAAIGVLGNNGVFATRAGRGLRQAFQRLFKPTQASTDALQEFNEQVVAAGGRQVTFFDEGGGFRGFGTILNDLDNALDAVFGDQSSATVDAEGRLAVLGKVFETVGGAAIRPLLNNIESYEEILETATQQQQVLEIALRDFLQSEGIAIDETKDLAQELARLEDQGLLTGRQIETIGEILSFYSTTARQARAQQDTLTGDTIKLRSAISGLAIEISGPLNESLRGFVQRITSGINATTDFLEAVGTVDDGLLVLASAADRAGLTGLGDALVAIANIDFGARIQPTIDRITAIGTTAREVRGDLLQITDALIGVTTRGLTGQDTGQQTFRLFEGLDSLASQIETGLQGALSVAGIEVDLQDLVTFTGVGGEGEPTEAAFEFEAGNFVSFNRTGDDVTVFAAGDFIKFLKFGTAQFFSAGDFISFAQDDKRQEFKAGDFLTFTRDRETEETDFEINLDALLPGLEDVRKGLTDLGEAVPGTVGFGLATERLGDALQNLGLGAEQAEESADLIGDFVGGINQVRDGLSEFVEAQEAATGLDSFVESLGLVTPRLADSTAAVEKVSAGLERLGVSAAFASVFAVGLTRTAAGLNSIAGAVRRIQEATPEERLSVIGEEIQGFITPITTAATSFRETLKEEGVEGIGERITALGTRLGEGLRTLAGTVDEVDGAEAGRKLGVLAFAVGGLAFVANRVRTDVLTEALGGLSSLVQSTINLGTEIVTGLGETNFSESATTFVGNITKGFKEIFESADVPGIADAAGSFLSAIGTQFRQFSEGQAPRQVGEAVADVTLGILGAIGGELTDDEGAQATQDLIAGTLNTITGALAGASSQLSKIDTDVAAENVTKLTAALVGLGEAGQEGGAFGDAIDNLNKVQQDIDDFIENFVVSFGRVAGLGELLPEGTAQERRAEREREQERRERNLRRAEEQLGIGGLFRRIGQPRTQEERFALQDELRRRGRERRGEVDEAPRLDTQAGDIEERRELNRRRERREAILEEARIFDNIENERDRRRVERAEREREDAQQIAAEEVSTVTGQEPVLFVDPQIRPGFQFGDEIGTVFLPVVLQPQQGPVGTTAAGIGQGAQPILVPLTFETADLPQIPAQTQLLIPQLESEPTSTFQGFMFIRTEVEDFKKDFTGTLKLKVSTSGGPSADTNLGTGPAISEARSGTLFWKGGPVRVAEGNNPELIRMPNGGAVMALTDQVISLPTASQIFSTENTQRILGAEPPVTDAVTAFAPNVAVPGVDLERAVQSIVAGVTSRRDNTSDNSSRSRSETKRATQEATEEIAKAVAEASAGGTINRGASAVGNLLRGRGGSRNRGSIGGGKGFFSPFAEGTDNAPSGLALVGEAGREFVITSSGGHLISEPTMMNFRGGEKVIRNDQTEAIISAMGHIRPYDTVPSVRTSSVMTSTSGPVDQSKHVNINVHPSHFSRSDAHSLQHVANLLH